MRLEANIPHRIRKFVTCVCELVSTFVHVCAKMCQRVCHSHFMLTNKAKQATEGLYVSVSIVKTVQTKCNLERAAVITRL